MHVCFYLASYILFTCFGRRLRAKPDTEVSWDTTRRREVRCIYRKQRLPSTQYAAVSRQRSAWVR